MKGLALTRSSYRRWLAVAALIAVPVALYFVLVKQRSWLPRTLPIESSYQLEAMSHHGQWIAFAGSNGIMLYDLQQGIVLKRIPLHMVLMQGLSVSPDDRTVWALLAELDEKRQFGDYELRQWDVSTGRELTKRRLPVGSDGSTRWLRQRLTADASRLIFCTYDRTLLPKPQAQEATVLDTTTGRVLRRWTLRTTADVFGTAISPSGRYLASSEHKEKAVALWDAARGQVIYRIPFEPGGTPRMVFSADERHLVIASRDMRFWDIASRRFVHTVKGMPGDGKMRTMQLARNSQTLAGFVRHKSRPESWIRVWDVASGRLLRSIPPKIKNTRADRSLAGVAPDGTVLTTVLWADFYRIQNPYQLWRVR